MYDQLEKFDQSVIDMIERLRSIIITRDGVYLACLPDCDAVNCDAG